MGQLTSRHHTDEPTSPQPTRFVRQAPETYPPDSALWTPTPVQIPDDILRRQALSTPEPPSRRGASRTPSSSQRPKRRSILGSLRGHRSPSTSTSTSSSFRSRLDSITTDSSSRRRWPMSKRRNAAQSVEAGEEAETDRAESSMTPSVSSAPNLHQKGNEREDEHAPPDVVADASSSGVAFPAPGEPPDDEPPDLESVSDSDEEEVLRPFSASEGEGDHAPPAPAPAAVAVSPRPAGRGFPPAGTLVVVQGVVHTSDVAPAPTPTPHARRASSVPAPAERRLSSLLTRPIRSRRSSYISPDSASSDSTSDTFATPEEFDDTNEDAAGSPAPEPRFPVLSPTSIDVLGTLLSVATAATAASLVTGSSDPLFSSGLALPGLGQTPAAESGRPMSPTPTAGLGGLGGLSVPALPQSSRDRMRNAWGSIRDRFGLNNGRPSPTEQAIPLPVPVEGADPRTQLLAEMARAFHLGMGLDNPDGLNSESTTGAEPLTASPLAEAAEPPLPPEDSFERFLLDLQTDLRRTLSDDRTPNEAETVPTSTGRPMTPPAPTSRPVPYAVYPQEDVTISTSDALDSDLPPLADDSDSDIDELEHVDAHDWESWSEETVVAPPPEPQESSASQEPPFSIPNMGPRTASGSERRPGGGINWWRMYRFPPMTAPHGQGQASPSLPVSFPGTLAATASPSVPGFDQIPIAPVFQTTPPAPASTPDSPDDAAQTGENNIIVPVIVVGLQSVNGNDARREGHEDHTHAQEGGLFSGAELSDPDEEDDFEDEFDGADMENQPTDAQANTRRGRSWHARAAERLRGWRPRRATNTAAEAPEGNGSTTFFIYVIGGYYPPNHHLVTGTDPLDSFEALWELAELLGQVKPPTATREDIDKSGLEIIKSADLEMYEKDGRVAPMCVDRCLICLDDYAHEDDLRLLSCRHLFHKDCVDKWLETGRNNCPACRTQGVATEPTLPTEVPA